MWGSVFVFQNQNGPTKKKSCLGSTVLSYFSRHLWGYTTLTRSRTFRVSVGPEISTPCAAGVYRYSVRLNCSSK
jgi:hypothetical protein